MVDGRGVEIAHHAQRRAARVRIGAMCGEMIHQAFERAALAVDAAMTGGQHFQRRFGADGGTGESGDGILAGHYASVSKREQAAPEDRARRFTDQTGTQPPALTRLAGKKWPGKRVNAGVWRSILQPGSTEINQETGYPALAPARISRRSSPSPPRHRYPSPRRAAAMIRYPRTAAGAPVCGPGPRPCWPRTWRARRFPGRSSALPARGARGRP